MNSNTEASKFSPQLYARIGGILYLILIIVGMISVLFVRDKLIVSLNAEATANNIQHSHFYGV